MRCQNYCLRRRANFPQEARALITGHPHSLGAGVEKLSRGWFGLLREGQKRLGLKSRNSRRSIKHTTKGRIKTGLKKDADTRALEADLSANLRHERFTIIHESGLISGLVSILHLVGRVGRVGQEAGVVTGLQLFQ